MGKVSTRIPGVLTRAFQFRLGTKIFIFKFLKAVNLSKNISLFNWKKYEFVLIGSEILEVLEPQKFNRVLIYNLTIFQLTVLSS